MTDSSSVTVPRDLIERILVSLTAAATSAAGRSLPQAADIYRTHIRELNSHVNPAPAPTLTREQQATEAGNRR